MKIETKFNIGDIVWQVVGHGHHCEKCNGLLWDDENTTWKPHSKTITRIKINRYDSDILIQYYLDEDYVTTEQYLYATEKEAQDICDEKNGV